MASYTFGTIIGSGGFAEVVNCTRTDDGTSLAAKRLLSRDPEHIKRFSREVRMQATLSHPNVVPIIGRNLQSDPPWVVLPLAKCNVREFLNGKSGEEFLWIVMEVALGLMHAHTNGVIHRDLKPENILIYGDDSTGHRACIADFGLGRFINRDSTEITLVNMGLGTIAYMAPEQFTDALNADNRADIYALGKILYEILSGQVPYPSLDTNQVPQLYRFIILKATNDEKDKRYQRMEEFVHDFKTALDHPEQLTRPTERIKELLKELPFTSQPNEIANELVKVLIDNMDDNTVMLSELPEFQAEALIILYRECQSELELVIAAYDDLVNGGASFSYSDNVANFYSRIWDACPSDKLRILIIIRLLHLGHDNNRWHVGSVLSSLVKKAASTDPVMSAIRDELKNYPRIKSFNREYLLSADLPAFVRDELNETD